MSSWVGIVASSDYVSLYRMGVVSGIFNDNSVMMALGHWPVGKTILMSDYATGNGVIDNMPHDVHTNHLETENTRAELSQSQWSIYASVN